MIYHVAFEDYASADVFFCVADSEGNVKTLPGISPRRVSRLDVRWRKEDR